MTRKKKHNLNGVWGREKLSRVFGKILTLGTGTGLVVVRRSEVAGVPEGAEFPQKRDLSCGMMAL